MCMNISLKRDNVHVHLHPKYIVACSAHAQPVSRSWNLTQTIDSWIRVKTRSESAGGLKVRALTQTARDAGLSPAWCSIFSCL